MIVVRKVADHAQEVLGLGDGVRARLEPVGLLQRVLHRVAHPAGVHRLAAVRDELQRGRTLTSSAV